MTLFGIHSFNLTQPHGGANPMSPEELPTISYRTLPLCPHPETAFFEILTFLYGWFSRKNVFMKNIGIFFFRQPNPFFAPSDN